LSDREEQQGHRFHSSPDRLRSPERVALLQVERMIDRSLEGLHAETMLEVGTGTGLLAEGFAARGLQVTGVDINPEMLAIARRLVPQGAFCAAAAEALPCLEDAFDLVLLGLVLHETDDPVRALREARRAARQRVVALEWPYRADSHGPPLAHRLQPAQVMALAEQAGFPEPVRLIELSHTVLYCLNA